MLENTLKLQQEVSGIQASWMSKIIDLSADSTLHLQTILPGLLLCQKSYPTSAELHISWHWGFIRYNLKYPFKHEAPIKDKYIFLDMITKNKD